MSIPIGPDNAQDVARHAARVRWLLVAATLVSVALSFIPYAWLLTYPIRIFVTIVHEGAHALIGVLTGGWVQQIVIEPGGSGHTLVQGGAPLLICPAGYLGTVLFGAACLLLGSRRHTSRWVLALMAGVTAVVTLLWAHPWPVAGAFGFGMGVVITLLLWAAARKLGRDAADFTAAFLSVQLCLNALMDLRTLFDLSISSSVQTDAANMAALTHLPAVFWALLWAATGVVVLLFTLRRYWREPRV